MNTALEKIASGASDAASLARRLTDSGLRSVSEAFQGMRIFGALSATTAEDVERDETHYVLVPRLGSGEKYAIYSKRILPPGVGATNSLPKARVFHVPDETGRKLMEQELTESLVRAQVTDDVGASDLADKLDQVADQIDVQTSRISGGLMLIGGAVALVNPLLGIGIAVKGLLPSISSKASKAGAEYVGEKLRGWNRSSAISKLEREASKVVKKHEPEIFQNPIIRSLEAVMANPGTDFDPALDPQNWVDRFDSVHHYEVTQEAVREVYAEILKEADLSSYQDSHVRWIRSVSDVESK